MDDLDLHDEPPPPYHSVVLQSTVVSGAGRGGRARWEAAALGWRTNSSGASLMQQLGLALLAAQLLSMGNFVLSCRRHPAPRAGSLGRGRMG